MTGAEFLSDTQRAAEARAREDGPALAARYLAASRVLAEVAGWLADAARSLRAGETVEPHHVFAAHEIQARAEDVRAFACAEGSYASWSYGPERTAVAVACDAAREAPKGHA